MKYRHWTKFIAENHSEYNGNNKNSTTSVELHAHNIFTSFYYRLILYDGSMPGIILPFILIGLLLILTLILILMCHAIRIAYNKSNKRRGHHHQDEDYISLQSCSTGRCVASNRVSEELRTVNRMAMVPFYLGEVNQFDRSRRISDNVNWLSKKQSFESYYNNCMDDFTSSRSNPNFSEPTTYRESFSDRRQSYNPYRKRNYSCGRDSHGSIGIDIKIDKWYEIFSLLDIQYTKANLTIHDIIHISLLIQTISCIYNTYKKLTDDFMKGLVTDFMIDHVIEMAVIQLHKHFTTIILLTPAMQRFLDVHSTIVVQDKVLAKYTERKKAYIPHTYLNPNKLNETQIDIFKQTWCDSNFVEITDAELVLKPFRSEPP